MARSCDPAPEPVRCFCRVPECLKRRKARGKENGRFLLEHWQDERAVYVTVICHDCGTQYTVEIAKR